MSYDKIAWDEAIDEGDFDAPDGMLEILAKDESDADVSFYEKMKKERDELYATGDVTRYREDDESLIG